MSLQSVIAKQAKKIDAGEELTQFDADELELELRRFAIDQIPNRLSESRFQGSGTAPSSSVPLTAEGISQAVARASAAEDVQAKRTANLWGVAASTLIAAGVTVLTGGTLSPALAASVVSAGRQLIPD